MPKRDMNDLLKKRMSATQQAAEIVVGDEAYETLFRGAPAPEASRFCDLPIERLRPFFTADIGFRPYPPEKLKAFSQQLAEQGSVSIFYFDDLHDVVFREDVLHPVSYSLIQRI